jgi:hypothetical protein
MKLMAQNKKRKISLPFVTQPQKQKNWPAWVHVSSFHWLPKTNNWTTLAFTIFSLG